MKNNKEQKKPEVIIENKLNFKRHIKELCKKRHKNRDIIKALKSSKRFREKN